MERQKKKETLSCLAARVLFVVLCCRLQTKERMERMQGKDGQHGACECPVSGTRQRQLKHASSVASASFPWIHEHQPCCRATLPPPTPIHGRS